MSDQDQTIPVPAPFDFTKFPEDTLFYERREFRDRRDGPQPARPPAAEVAPPKAPAERRAKKERRRRIDPTTFEKQYTDDELEFMNAMQDFKSRTGRPFPSHGEVLQVAFSLGYRRAVVDDATEFDEESSGSVDLPVAV